jgi:hypothetical protein
MMPVHGVDAFVDGKAAVRAWINGLTWLVGAGHPLANGAHLAGTERDRHRSPAGPAYAQLSVVDGGSAADGPLSFARVSVSVFGGTGLVADLGAVALANAFLWLETQTPVAVQWGEPPNLRRAVILSVGNVTGPLEVPGSEPQRLVDADFEFTPSP